MSNEKTLATVKHGGCVQLGDWLPPLPCTDYNAYSDGTEPLFNAQQMRDYARTALSAQPSPGVVHPAVIPDTLVNGGALKMALNVLRRAGKNEVADELESTATTQPSPGGQDASFEQAWLSATDYYAVSRDAAHFIWQAALAARQPVGELVAYMDLGAGGYMDVGTDLSNEELEALPKGRHMLGIIGTHGADGYKPAQAVDLGRWSQRHADDLHVAVHTALSVHAGSLSKKKRAAISAHVKRTLIDSHSAGGRS